MQNNQSNVPKMKKRDQRKKPPENKAKKVEKDPTQVNVEKVQTRVNVATKSINGKIYSACEKEMTWRIEKFRCDKAHSVTFMLPRKIRCSIALYPTASTVWNDNGPRRGGSYNRRESKFFVVKPMVFFNEIPDKRDDYEFLVKIQPATGNLREEHDVISTYQTASTRPEGFNCFGPTISSKNFRSALDRDGNLDLDITFTIRELLKNKTIEPEEDRSTLAKAMSKLFMSKNCSDVAIILGDDKIPGHKVILAAHSKTFAKMINENSAEIEIDMRAPKEAYIELIRFLYDGTIKDIKNNLDSLLMLAKEFEVEKLQKFCVMEVKRAVKDEYAKFIGKSEMLDSVIGDSDKTMKFYKLLDSMDELLNESTQTSLKSLEGPQSSQNNADATKEDIQLPTIVLDQPSNLEQPPEINEEILTSSLADMIDETAEPQLEVNSPDVAEANEDSTDNSTCEIQENIEEISAGADMKEENCDEGDATALENSAEDVENPSDDIESPSDAVESQSDDIESPSGEEISNESTDECADKNQEENPQQAPEIEPTSEEISIDKADENPEMIEDQIPALVEQQSASEITSEAEETPMESPKTVEITANVDDQASAAIEQENPGNISVDEEKNPPEVQIDNPDTQNDKPDTQNDEEKPEIATNDDCETPEKSNDVEIESVNVEIPSIVVDNVPETQIEDNATALPEYPTEVKAETQKEEEKPANSDNDESDDDIDYDAMDEEAKELQYQRLYKKRQAAQARYYPHYMGRPINPQLGAIPKQPMPNRPGQFGPHGQHGHPMNAPQARSSHYGPHPAMQAYPGQYNQYSPSQFGHPMNAPRSMSAHPSPYGPHPAMQAHPGQNGHPMNAPRPMPNQFGPHSSMQAHPSQNGHPMNAPRPMPNQFGPHPAMQAHSSQFGAPPQAQYTKPQPQGPSMRPSNFGQSMPHSAPQGANAPTASNASYNGEMSKVSPQQAKPQRKSSSSSSASNESSPFSRAAPVRSFKMDTMASLASGNSVCVRIPPPNTERVMVLKGQKGKHKKMGLFF